MKVKYYLIVLMMSVVASLYAAEPMEFKVGEFTFQRPEGWEWIAPSSGMRKAQLNVPGRNGKVAEVTFFHFGAGQGGGVQANVARWFGQFQNAKTSQHEEIIGKTRVVFVEAAGTFLSGMPGGPATPQENYALRGAILESEGGDVFVKMTGPADIIQTAEANFFAMIRTAAQ